MLNDEIRYRLLKQLEQNPDVSQRELAREFGVSLGKINYCLRALAAKGWIKAANFKNSPNKRGYFYQITPRGLDAKARLTFQFLKIKQAEYKAMKAEIESLEREAREYAAGKANEP
jgi:EPS-associated MarR family transcriptional regulator